MNNTPKIRFKGFTDAWEQRKSGEVAPLRGGFAFKSNEYGSEGIPIVRISNILSDGTVGADYAYYGEQENDEAFALYDGAAVLAMSGATTGKVSVLRAEKGEKYYQNQRVGYFVPTEKCDYSFIRTVVKSQLFMDQLSSVLVAGAQPNVSSKEIDEFEYMIPRSEKEQKAIGSFFESLDNLITLHQRKCDETKELKKYMLQKMFPKNGEKYPEIRFAGFTDAWEQRKLGDLCERVVRKNKNKESDLPLTISSQDGLIDQRDFFNRVVAAKDMSNYYLLHKGEFAYNKSYSNGYDYGSIKRLNAYEKGCLSTLYICFGITSEDVDSDYLECFFDTLKWYDDISMICAEGARNHGLLNVDTKAFFEEVSIDIPSSKEEQRRIAAYLNNLDNLITLHQRKCDEVKELKKYMLQKMFPQSRC